MPAIGAPVLWRFIRPATLPAPVAGVVGGAVAAAGGWPERPGALLAAVVSAVLLTGASNGINQVADLETDRINRPDRPLPSGALSLREGWLVTWILFVGALAVAALVNAAFLACVALTVPVTGAYSLPPLRTKRFPLVANATIATPRGLLLVVAGWAAGGGAARPDAWTLGALMWLYVFGAATTKDFADTEGDRATGCVTLPLLWGAKRAAVFVTPFLVVPFLLLPAAAARGWLAAGTPSEWGVLGSALAVVGAVAGVRLVRDPQPPADGSPHPSWGLMYLQLTAAHAGFAWMYV